MVNNQAYLFITFQNEEMDILKVLIDSLCNLASPMVVVIVNLREDGSVNFLCRSTNTKVNAGYLVKQAALLSAGNGGGSATFAQGGGKTQAHLVEVEALLKDLLANEA